MESNESNEIERAYESVHVAGILGSIDQVQDRSARDIVLLGRDL